MAHTEAIKNGPSGGSSSHGPIEIEGGLTGGPSSSSGSLSELECKILELNKAGKSTRAITRAIKTPRTTIQRILDRLSQDPSNGVKDNSRNAIKEDKWFKIIQHIRDIDLPSFEKELSIKLTPREILYRLEKSDILSESQGVIVK